jgi:RimJ/RimL family protein N-acetyltransferase
MLKILTLGGIDLLLLKKDNLTIRNATIEDANLLCSWWNDGKIMAHAGFPNGLGITEDSIKEKLLTDSDDKYRRLIIEVDSFPVGEMSYRNIGNSTAEIGIKICNFEKQDRGYGSCFLKMLIRKLFDFGYKKIILDTNIKNERAQHVYEKIGFKRVGVRINAFVDQLGISQTAVDYELNLSELKIE